ncbi:hypothetical protein DA508_06605, partial [Campylobacter coli]|nr:hypothetical protein [Campylobacter coli]
MKVRKNIFLKVLVFTIVIHDKEKIYHFLGIPFFKVQIFNKSKKYSLFGLPILKKYYNDKITDLFINEQKSNNEIENVLQRLFKYDIVKESDIAFLNIKKTINQEKNAVFGVLPPEKTGIAIFNHNAFVDCEYFDIFSDIRDLSIARGLSKNVFDLKTFIKFDASYLYKKFIYILGNSSHNNPYLNMAIRSTNKEKSWLYIHEADLNGLLYAHCGYNFLTMRVYLI